MGHSRLLTVVSREVVKAVELEPVVDVVEVRVDASEGPMIVFAVVGDVLAVVVDVLVVVVDVLVVVVDVLVVVVAVVDVVVSAVVAHVGDDSERTRALLTNLKLLNMDRRGESRVADGFSQSLVEVDVVDPVLVVDADVSTEVLSVVEVVNVVDVVEVVVEGIECGSLTLVIQVTSPEDDASADSVVQSPALSLAKISSVVQPPALRCRKMSSVFCPSSPTWSRVKKSSPFFGLCTQKRKNSQ